ncbi:MAG TPA: hypothetical protein VKT49_18405 [Bryobacteraceae bacterium]|nr:hypothetical protein [Bryobacteraceae bacterium]
MAAAWLSHTCQMRAVVLSCLAAVTAARATDLDTAQVLKKVRNQMAETLARLPDYTCRENHARSVQRAGSNHYENRDLLRVDVAFLNGRELYAWPGSRFGQESLLEMARGGSIGTGNFGLLGKAVYRDQPLPAAEELGDNRDGLDGAISEYPRQVCGDGCRANRGKRTKAADCGGALDDLVECAVAPVRPRRRPARR